MVYCLLLVCSTDLSHSDALENALRYCFKGKKITPNIYLEHFERTDQHRTANAGENSLLIVIVHFMPSVVANSVIT